MINGILNTLLGQAAPVETSLGKPTLPAIGFFFLIVVVTLIITYWAARKTKTSSEFYAAGRSVSALQNGFALAGDYMSAASFLGISGMVALKGYDGMIYATGWLVGWPALMFLVAEPLRNLGKFTFADVVAFRLRQRPVRIAAAIGGILTVLFYTIAQMVGSGSLIQLMFGLKYEYAEIIVGVVMLAYVLFGGMLATTWVQIIKAVLLMIGIVVMSLFVLERVGFNPIELFNQAEAAGQAKESTFSLGPGTFLKNNHLTGALLDRPFEAGCEGRALRPVVGSQHADGDELGGRGEVVDDPSAGGAVPDDVDRLVIDDARVLAVELNPNTVTQAAADGRVIAFDAGVDDGHGDALAAAVPERPCSFQPAERPYPPQPRPSVLRERSAPRQ
jgi:hypothetical protein